MGKVVGIFGMSGEGKTTATIVNPDGSYDFSKEGYNGLDPDTHFIINCDKKELPFPGDMWTKEKKNYAATAEYDNILKCIEFCAKNPKIKSISIDTLNSYLLFKEFNDRKKLTFDQWKDMALDIVELINLCNTRLREDQVAYLQGHVELITDVNGDEKKVLATTGKKLKKIFIESLFPIVLFTRVETGLDGDNKHYFETKSAKSTAKTPIGMMPEFLIPNSLKLVDDLIRSYYKM